MRKFILTRERNHPRQKKAASRNIIQPRFLLLFMTLLTASMLFSLGGCKKDGGGGAEEAKNYFFKATVGGKEINYYSVNFQGGGNDDRWEHIVVGGFESSLLSNTNPGPPGLDFEIWKQGGNIGVGTYSTPAEMGMIARYYIQTDKGTLIWNTSWADDVFTVKIEEISKQGIKGTFSGTVRNQAGQAISITNGSFNLPYNDLVNP
ncbi:hypothetical protein [Pedobacter sp. N23S346]|uniref:hypothetical protein n=1 Tax=Pedobacter sp. N23S346 TaxID=3402750 RepID=UPI003AC567C6